MEGILGVLIKEVKKGRLENHVIISEILDNTIVFSFNHKTNLPLGIMSGNGNDIFYNKEAFQRALTILNGDLCYDWEYKPKLQLIKHYSKVQKDLEKVIADYEIKIYGGA